MILGAQTQRRGDAMPVRAHFGRDVRRFIVFTVECVRPRERAQGRERQGATEAMLPAPGTPGL
jgi:hypothetical protein